MGTYTSFRGGRCSTFYLTCVLHRIQVPFTVPEHLMGRPVNARSDVFGLGLLLYEVLTGRRPFCHEDNPDPT